MRGLALQALLLSLTGCDRFFGLTDPAPFPAADAGPSDGALDTIVEDGLVAWYPMEAIEDRGTRDESGHSNHVQCTTGCPTVTAGVVGNALLFGGRDAFVGDQLTALATPDAYTIAVWVRHEGAIEDSACAASKALRADDYVNSWQLCVHYERVVSWSSDQQPLTSGALITVGAWHHVALTWDGQQRQIFIDGVGDNTRPTSEVEYADGPLGIGADYDPAQLNEFVGAMDDLRIYDRALRLAEIGALADQRRPPN